jgi:fused signal recognition particle receptor
MLKFFKKKTVDNQDIASQDETEINFTGELLQETVIEDAPKIGVFSRLKAGLSRTSSQLTDGITGIFSQRKLTHEMVTELEELLIMADMGALAASKITDDFARDRFDKNIEAEQVKELLAEQITNILQPSEKAIDLHHSPTVIMVVGVNGNGKTTTIGKLASHFKANGKSVMLAAADTFRAAAVEQLQVWANRVNVPIITGEDQADPASVAYMAMQEATAQNIDILLIDTAGRLQNKHNLMQELQKIKRVLGKNNADAPHHILMVLDGTTGQNAISQVKVFEEMVGVTGLIVTKLDGTAKGGVVVALAEQFKLPLHFIGVGESVEDFQIFQADIFAKNLMGLYSTF